MPIRLIDPTATTPIEIEGTVFQIKPMNNGEKLRLAKGLQNLQENEDGYNELLSLIAPFIESVAGHEDKDVEKILFNIEDAKSQSRIIDAVLGVSTLSEAESKNSGSSSATPTESAGGSITKPSAGKTKTA